MYTFTRMSKFSSQQLAAMASTLNQMQDLENCLLNGDGPQALERIARSINIHLYTTAQRSGAFHKSLFNLPLIKAYSDNYGMPFNRAFPLQLSTCRYIAYKPLIGEVRIRDIFTGEEYVDANKGVPVMERAEGVYMFKGARVLNNTSYDIGGSVYVLRESAFEKNAVLN